MGSNATLMGAQLTILNNFLNGITEFWEYFEGGGGGGVTCRVKIDPLDLGKPYTKYIWGDSPLQMETNEPIPAVKVINFNISHVET